MKSILMKVTNLKNESIINNDKFNSKFIFTEIKKLNVKCNILEGDFYLDTHNYFPLSSELYTFSDLYSWGDINKYNKFYDNNFFVNFQKNVKNFKEISNVFVLGTSPHDNYYRNIITFLPRMMCNPKNKIRLAIHRNSSNKLRDFIMLICKKMNIDIRFVYLDDGFYKFINSEIPQFFDKEKSIKILNNLKARDSKKNNKIFITRQNCNYRNLINESDIIKKLSKLGYVTKDLNNLSVTEQIELFSNAESIICPTGSGLANTVFCNPGTKIFEITPRYKYSYEKVFKNRFREISKYLNLNHQEIEADSVDLDISNKSQSIISSKALKESNYYKNLILRLELIDKIILN